VVEREKLDNLLKERRIIQEMRKTYLGEETVNPQALPPLLFAGILLEGGIIGYDSNMQTGGIGARLLGIGADIKYRLDTITIYLRAVSTRNGQVLASVVTHKTIASIGLQGGMFKFIAVDKILEAEAGFTKNEPEQLAVQQAIEKAVYAMVIEGSEQGLWAFADKAYQSRAIDEYRSQLFSSREQATARAEAVKAGATQTAQNTPGTGGPKSPVKPFATAIVQGKPQPRAAAATTPRAQPARPPAKAAAANNGPTTAELVSVLSAMQAVKSGPETDAPF
jgi:curli production assembly/transport component CsgG